MEFFIIILCLLFLVFVASGGVQGAKRKLSNGLYKAHRTNQLMPLVSMQKPKITIKEAYAIQTEYVKRRLVNDSIAGYKAGLTSKEGQQRFGINSPVAGVLFQSGMKTANSIIKHAEFTMAMLEVEIGYFVKNKIDQPIQSVRELQNNIKSVMPVIEVQDLCLADMKIVKSIDIIAANVTSTQFIIGKEVNTESFDLNSIETTLFFNGKKIDTGRGSDTIGNQWEAALWLVNTMIEQGWVIEPGHILITGALGRMIPGKPGKYMANYGSFGTISFSVD